MTSILIPAYNEAARITATIEAARKIDCLGGEREIIVADDGSVDETAQLAATAGADQVVRLPHGGKGAALQAALAAASGEYLLLLDADLGATAVQAQELLAPVLRGEADMTIAAFPAVPGKRGGLGLVVRLARWGIRALTGCVMQSPLSGQRALRREVIDGAGGFAAGWGVEVALTVQALRCGFRVVEIPLTMTHRVTGRTAADWRHRAAQLAAAATTLARLAIRDRR